jgi:outer membrane protein
VAGSFVLNRKMRARGLCSNANDELEGSELKSFWMAKLRANGPVYVSVVVGLSVTSAANATTLSEALGAAYGDNPTLTGARAALRATDEQSAIERAAGRPTLGAQASQTQGLYNLRKFESFNRQVSAGAQLSVPLYQGGRVRNAVAAADTRAASGREALRSSEGAVLVDTVTAYMDVLRDRAIIGLNENNVKVLATNLQETQAQYRLGTLTLTDVSQSEARLEEGNAQLTTARANLVDSEGAYQRVTGLVTDDLEEPPPLPALPQTLDQAEREAIANNPDIAAAGLDMKAAKWNVQTARSSRMPTVSVVASDNYIRYDQGSSNIYTGDVANLVGNSAYVGVTLSLPLYQGGLPSAQVRQAQDFEQQAIENQTAVERQVVINTKSAYSTYQAALSVILSSEKALKANTLALKGAQAEQTVGLRQVLDVLNAEQEKLQSEVNLLSARHDAYVAGFRILNALGLANHQHLGLDRGTLYDPLINFEKARHAIGDWQDNPQPQPIASRIYGPESDPKQY